MPAIVTRLRIAGFKSFAEPTTIDILPGLTGIVGPNGCGKSNVVEALRWAMGETSARSLRGGEMDEVIFAGSAARAQRDIAEVVITLDEAAGLAPPPLQGETELQVSRQIERGAGSTYRVNGRETRARDVQTMFADIASGARSSAMVSQGRVAFLVDARPDERRSVLEEAAGITGLHARRHEAELRLRAAEANLARVADLRAGLEVQHASLTRQAEAARTYRAAVEELSAAERWLLGVLLGRAAHARFESGRALTDARAGLALAEAAAEKAGAEERAAEASLNHGAGASATAMAAAERARAADETVEGEQARAAVALENAELRLVEVVRDHALAGKQAMEAEELVARLLLEAGTLHAVLDRFDGDHAAAVEAGAEAGAAVRREMDHLEARGRLDRELASRATTLGSLSARLRTVKAALAEAAALAPEPGTLESAAEAVGAGERTLAAAALDLEAADEARRRAADVLATVAREGAARRDDLARAEARHAAAADRRERLAAEHDALAARHATAASALVGPGSLERSRTAARLAQAAAKDAADALDAAELARFSAEASRTEARAAAEAAQARVRETAIVLDREQSERERLEAQHSGLAAEHASACDALVDEATLAAAREAVAAAAETVGTARDRASDAERRRERAAEDAAAARLAIGEREAACLAAETEIRALSAITDGEETSLLSTVLVPETLEAAVAAGLGEALCASLDPSALRFWRALDPLEPCPALPDGVTPLGRLLRGPTALARALSQIGLLDGATDGTLLQASLLPGQILVTRGGGSFRWDGHVARDGQVSPMAERLQARRRREACHVVLAEARTSLPPFRLALDEAVAAGAASDRDLRDARALVEIGSRAAVEAAASETALVARAVTARARMDGVAAELSRVAAALETASRRERSALTASDARPEAEALALTAGEAEREAEQRAAEARRVREELRTAEAMAAKLEAEARRLAARDEETTSLLGTIEPALSRLRGEVAAAEAELADAASICVEASVSSRAQDSFHLIAEAEMERAVSGEVASRAAREHAEAEVVRARGVHDDILSRTREAAGQRSRLVKECQALLLERAQAGSQLFQARRQRDSLGVEAGALDAARRAEVEAKLRLAALEAEALLARNRLALLTSEIEAAARRSDEAAARAAEMAMRLDETRRAHASVKAVPSSVAERRAMTAAAFAAAETARKTANARALAGQVEMAAAREARRGADLGLAGAREVCSRAEAAVAQADAAADDIEGRVREAVGEIAAAREPSAASEAEARRRVARATKARDEVGPVNLLAEREASEVGSRLAALVQEAAELEEAVARLRGSVGHLNREGRERLTASFVRIDAQFRALFARMFDGGRAHLALVGSDDPLEAGLEIYAQPPGKKLATLSLLSGGEQALTALSLIFAVFRCSPAPICVLDEVDAPLDDANVERFCRLVSDMAQETATRFLVVTHHQLTMASMDRLYGVTMQERGVSRVLSVDLGRAVDLAAW